ncbi:RNA-directed DNA polymerase, eukaryota, reverse transcriptase zinc-binding domain protein [Tanacetum coccineum]|uniref:RNA-directed DNA polymerase, eukaryota, reverse transcriptase zinc-binding domain protein n=1 Tax=Tanacetum coccineum TaxID=301880 RepID=A0ABQ5ANP1_9ASTR
MSPYLFTLIMEVLTLMVQRKVRNSHQFKYHWGRKELKLTQLCFADDLLMLSNGYYKSVEVLKDGLMEFSKTSGLVPNMSKSTIFFGSVKDIKKKRILEVLPFSVGKLPTKYLGVPLITKIIEVTECNQLVERVKQKAAILCSLMILGSLKKFKKRIPKELKPQSKDTRRTSGNTTRNDPFPPFLIIEAQTQVIEQVAVRSDMDPKMAELLGPWNEALLCKHLWNVCSQKESLWVTWVNVVKLKVCEIIPFKKIYEARLSEKANVAEMINNNEWIWPNEWNIQYSDLNKIIIPKLNDGVTDCTMRKDKNGIDGRDWQDRMMVWDKGKQLLCPLCKTVNDSHEHLFFKCTYSEEVWDEIKTKLKRRNWDNDWKNVVAEIASGGCKNNIKSILERIAISMMVITMVRTLYRRFSLGCTVMPFLAEAMPLWMWVEWCSLAGVVEMWLVIRENLSLPELFCLLPDMLLDIG